MFNLKKYKKQIIISLSILVVLIFAFWYGGNAPSLRGFNVIENKVSVTPPTTSQNPKSTPVATIDPSYSEDDFLVPTTTQKEQSEQPLSENTQEQVLETTTPSENSSITPTQETPIQEEIVYSENQGMEINESTGTDEYKTEPVPVGKPVPVEPEEVKVTDNTLTCTLTIRSDTILNNLQWLDPEKKELVPKDGVIFPETTVTFFEGESVFNVLLREMKKNKIHFEYAKTPAYNSVYIEAINNIYEFDCGELSGWKYKVNDWFPNYGCSRYQLKNNDSIEIHYTCDLGADIGAKEQ